MKGQREGALNRLEAKGIDRSRVLIYEDDDVTGMISIMDRLDGRRCIEDARRGLFIDLYCWSVDRLGRKSYVCTEVRELLKSTGVKLQSGALPFSHRSCSEHKHEGMSHNGCGPFRQPTGASTAPAGLEPRPGRLGGWAFSLDKDDVIAYTEAN